MNASGNGASEWKRSWFVPMSAALGYATGVIHIYSIGPFIEPLTSEFNWSRARISSGVALAALISGLFAIPVGMLIDRVGPRRIALIGVVLMTGSYALLGTASGSKANWMMLWLIVAVGTFFVQTTVWSSAVVSQFEKSRGLALAITLCGASLASAIFPVIATWLIETYGWRKAFPIHAAAWLILVYPVLLLCFRGARDRGGRGKVVVAAPGNVAGGISLAEGLRTPAFYKLLLAGGLFAFTAIGAVVHFVPILTGRGTEPLAAAGIASLIGIFSIVGRLGVGVLLDRFQGHLVGALAGLPAVVASLLLLAWGGDSTTQMLAAIFLGLTLGAEVDVVAYLASRHFGLRNFGSLYGALVMALALGGSFGPLVAGMMFDRFGGYGEFLGMMIAALVAAVASLLLLGPAPQAHAVASPEKAR